LEIRNLKSEYHKQRSVWGNAERGTANATGFTLLEILITIFIFSIVVSTVFVSFNTVMSTASAVDRDTTLYEMGKNCLDRMLLDLSAVYALQPPQYRVPDIDDPPDPYRIVGDVSDAGGTAFGRLRFASFAHLPIDGNPAEGISEIVYYVQEIDDREFVLRRRDHLEPYEPFEERKTDPVLCRRVLSLSFTYLDEEWEESDRWDSESKEFDRATPAAVKIRLSLGEESRPLLMETVLGLPVARKGIE